MIIQDETLRSLYQETGTERLQTLQLGLLQLEQSPQSTAIIDTLQRELHGLRGDSESIGMTAMAALIEPMAAILTALQQQTIAFTLALSDCLYEGVYAMEQLVHAAAVEEADSVDVRPVSQRLAAVLESPGDPAPPAPLADIPGIVPYIEDDELREIYRITCADRLQILEIHLQYLQGDSVEAETWETLRREIHSLKGDSRAVGLDAVASIAEALEDIIKHMQGQFSPALASDTTCLHEGLATIRGLVQEAIGGEPSGTDLTRTLETLLAAGGKGQRTSASLPEPSSEPASVSQIEDAELREIYSTTSQERLEQLEAGLLRLEQSPQNSELLADLMREAHSLKGDARSIGVTAVEGLAHAVEDVLSGLQQGQIDLDSAVSDRLYQGIDAIGQLVQAAVTGQPGSHAPDALVSALQGLVPASPETTETATPLEAIAIPSPAAPPLPEALFNETVRVQTSDLDALRAQTEALSVNRIQIAQTTAQVEQLMALWEEWQAHKSPSPTPNTAVAAYEEQLETQLLTLKSTIQKNSSTLEVVAEELRNQVRRLQLLPVARLFQPLSRTVRDLSKQQGKKIDLVLEGEAILADKRLLEGIRDALLHLVRNAIDHGIESPEERSASGKPAVATLQVKAYQTAVSFMVEITEDGRGLNLEKIKQTAIRRKLYAPADLDAMTPSQIQRLILAPGFSTRDFITELSGRGVGLDVVRTQVERLKGSIEIESSPGQGCTFRLQLSTSMSTANVVLVESQGVTFALPVEFLQMTMLVAPEQIINREGKAAVPVGDRTVTAVDLADVLQLKTSPLYPWMSQPVSAARDRRPCVLLQVGEERIGFFVDRLIAQQEVVSKPLGPLLQRVQNVSGATILGTGEVCMILNPPDLIKAVQQQPVSSLPAAATRAAAKPVILLVEDSPTVRIQEKRLFEAAGYDVVTAANGVEGFKTLQTRTFDAMVTDVEMPLMDGFSLVAKIRQQAAYDPLPIVFVTTLDTDADRRRGADVGANAYIVKGRFNQEVLLGTLARLI